MEVAEALAVLVLLRFVALRFTLLAGHAGRLQEHLLVALEPTVFAGAVFCQAFLRELGAASSGSLAVPPQGVNDVTWESALPC
jgi:hypothetical protein